MRAMRCMRFLGQLETLVVALLTQVQQPRGDLLVRSSDPVIRSGVDEGDMVPKSAAQKMMQAQNRMFFNF